MRVTTGILAAGMIAGIASVASAADTDGWYVGAQGGVNLQPTEKYADTVAAWKSTENPGYVINGAVGYGVNDFRLEGEVGWRSSTIDKLKFGSLSESGSGSLRGLDLMVNAYHDFIMPDSPVTPYLGLGVGGFDLSASNVGGVGAPTLNNSQWVFAYQGIAGVSYKIDDSLSLTADYRYLRTASTSLDENSPAHASGAHTTYSTHGILVGFVYHFPVPAPAPEPAAPPPPLPPAQPVQAPAPMVAAPIAKNFMVFFDFDKSKITIDAQKIINEASAAAAANKTVSIEVIGHTDTSGSVAYNQALSVRRAVAVKAALVKLGIPANEISTVGKGKSDLLVPTKDGVREPQNRRAQILLD